MPSRNKYLPLVGLLFLIYQSPSLAAGDREGSIDWQEWDQSVFTKAKQDGRHVLLYMEAVWCHWCHVMDEKTYHDPAVMAYIAKHYVPVKVDQDRRPDLGNRYKAWGWPATVALAADGTEIVKRAGYIAPEPFLRLLKAIVADPSPEAAAIVSPIAVGSNSHLSAETKAELRKRHIAAMDEELGGYKRMQRYLPRDAVEYAMVQAAAGDSAAAQRARASLNGALGLIDPAWGGVYQYSTQGDWQHLHYEKLSKFQGEYLRIYALAYAQFTDSRYATAVHDIVRYLDSFMLSPAGAYYASQDADLIQGEHADDYFALNDKERRAKGIPRIDKNLYARENGQIIEALAIAGSLLNKPDYIQRAKQAAEWALSNRPYLSNNQQRTGGFRHADQDPAGPYLADNLYMARGLLELYAATGERHWLKHAANAADFIGEHFRVADGGFISAEDTGGPVAAPRDRNENIAAVRFFNLLQHYTGQAEYRELAEHGMRFLATPAIALATFEDAGILLADQELNQAPPHLTVVGKRDDTMAQQLFHYARQLPGWYRRLEWWDRQEGPLPHADVPYPKFPQAAGYACAEQRCSLPAFKLADYQNIIRGFGYKAP